MIKEKLNEKILKAYIEASTSWKCAASYFVIYVFGVSFLLVIGTRVNANNILTAGVEMINELANTIRAVSTAAALVGVGTGAFLKKFSLGKPDRIETGNKLITNSIWAWVMINGLILILNYFAHYFEVGNVEDTFDQGVPNI